jgi:hypothetical protein
MADYATVQQMRDEGVTVAQASDPQLLAKVQRASRLIERWTGRWFYPRAGVFLMDGKTTGILQIGPPIISISEIRLLGQGSVFITSSNEIVDLTQVRVFNRHLTEEMFDPDDRNDPRIQWLRFDPYLSRGRSPEIFSAGLFPLGVQNIQVTGMFGYTDPDGSPTGKTPDLINFACMLMVVRDLPMLADVDARDESRNRARVISLTTRGQSIAWSPNKTTNGWTGDREIDDLIASFRRPPTLGAV